MHEYFRIFNKLIRDKTSELWLHHSVCAQRKGCITIQCKEFRTTLCMLKRHKLWPCYNYALQSISQIFTFASKMRKQSLAKQYSVTIRENRLIIMPHCLPYLVSTFGNHSLMCGQAAIINKFAILNSILYQKALFLNVAFSIRNEICNDPRHAKMGLIPYAPII